MKREMPLYAKLFTYGYYYPLFALVFVGIALSSFGAFDKIPPRASEGWIVDLVKNIAWVCTH